MTDLTTGAGWDKDFKRLKAKLYKIRRNALPACLSSTMSVESMGLHRQYCSNTFRRPADPAYERHRVRMRGPEKVGRTEVPQEYRRVRRRLFQITDKVRRNCPAVEKSAKMRVFQPFSMLYMMTLRSCEQRDKNVRFFFIAVSLVVRYNFVE